MGITLIAGVVGSVIVAGIVVALATRRRGAKALLGLGSVSQQWLQSHRQQEEL